MAGFEALIAKALLNEGTEITLQELVDIMGLRAIGSLQATTAAFERVGRFGLQITPGVESGDFATPRVLRSIERPSRERIHDRALAHCAQGESSHVEFKSSLFADMRRFQATGELHSNSDLEGECLKTVCAFLNSDGGDLLIGIDDSGQYSDGLRCDLKLRKCNVDAWTLYWSDRIKQRFHNGLAVLPYIESHVIDIGPGPICLVRVLSRSEPSFVQRVKGGTLEFFARFGPRSDSMSMPEFFTYMQRRQASL